MVEVVVAAAIVTAVIVMLMVAMAVVEVFENKIQLFICISIYFLSHCEK